MTKIVRSFGLKQTAVVNPWTYQTESHEDHKEQEDLIYSRLAGTIVDAIHLMSLKETCLP